ncbi:unnamed protein product [Ilex paraguariensis]|uniref:TCP domain-containing protein n=1 Tax=Ilex paraguariensis TaxID=185542 RepID=A0ABC8T0U4_9AQUA
MMTTSSREAGFTTKQESNTSDGKISRAPSSSTSWSRLKDPRIVRVSRAFGGKDRHSKVCTVRGLRDRRIRLSVPTAIQLYDLQDRLGLNQPSKVVDWLLNAAKHDIDDLPALQMPPGNFALNYHPMLTSHGVGVPQSDKEGLKINSGLNWNDPLELSRSSFWSSDVSMRDKSKGVARETANDEETWTKRNEEGKQGDQLEGHSAYASSSNLFPRPSHSLPGFLNNGMPYSSFLRWDPANLSLSNPGSYELTPQTDDFHNLNVMSLPSTLSVATGSQVLVYPPAIQAYLPSPVTAAVELDPKQINFQMLSPSSQNPMSNSLAPTLQSLNQSMRPFQFSMTPRFLASQSVSRPGLNKDGEFPSK